MILKKLLSASPVFLIALTTACGGGGGGGGSSISPPAPPPPVAPPPVPVPVTITCPNGSLSTATTVDAAKAACPAPKIISITPVEGAVLSPDALNEIVALTDSTLDVNSLVTSNVTLKAGGADVAGVVSASSATGISFVPAAKLGYGLVYSFTATVRDTLGKSLQVTVTFSTNQLPPVTGITLLVGTPSQSGSTDGTLQSANFHRPGAIAKDAAGNLYVSDGCIYNRYDAHSLVRKISPDGVVTSVAGSASYMGKSPTGADNRRCISGLVAHPDGNLYTFDSMNAIVEKVNPQGQVSIFAGRLGVQGFKDGTGPSSELSGTQMTADQQGSLFIADTKYHTIRKIDSTANVTTYAGKAGVAGSADGGLQDARFTEPLAVKSDVNGNLYVTDQIGIRVISNGVVKTLIPFKQLMKEICGSEMDVIIPSGLDISSDGRIAVAVNDCRHVAIYQNNTLMLLLGNPDVLDFAGSYGDTDGIATKSRFYGPTDVIFMPNGDLIISDIQNNNIKRYTPSTNLVSLYAGRRNYISPVDGSRETGKLSNPFCLQYSKFGDILFSQDANTVRAFDAAGNLKSLVTVNNGICVIGANADGSFIAAANVMVKGESASEVRKYSNTGQLLNAFAGNINVIPFLLHAAVDGSGDIFFGDKNGFVSRYSNGVVSVFSDRKIEQGDVPALALTNIGEIIVSGGCTISKISPTGTVTRLTLTTVNPCGYQDGPLANAKFSFVRGIAIGPNGAIYVADLGNSVIRRIYNGIVDTIAGSPGFNETALGTGTGKIHDLRGIAYDPATNSIIVLTGNAILRASLPP